MNRLQILAIEFCSGVTRLARVSGHTLVRLEGNNNRGVPSMDSVLGLVRHAGNDSLFRAVEVSLLATLAGQPFHIHAEGLRGTGKTTIMRAARQILPPIRRVRDCLYNCDPDRPHCPAHRGLSPDEVAAVGDEWVPMPLLEISHSARVGTVVGSIDLGRLVSPTRPEAALLPGTLPQAHRGILFVDEVNRLAETAPELADILLDVMGTKPGRVQIEETGMPRVELPVQVSVWAASNPDEDPGPLEEIRRQLSDRFDLAVYTDRPGEAGVVERILALAEEREEDEARAVRTEQFRTRLRERADRLVRVEVPDSVRQSVAELYSRFNLESLRAVQALQAGVRLMACLEGRGEAAIDDLVRVAPLALRHRVDPESLKKLTAHLSGLAARPAAEGAAAQPVRPRFPGVSFGAAAVEPLQTGEPGSSLAGGDGSAHPGQTGRNLPGGADEQRGLGQGAGARPGQHAALDRPDTGTESRARWLNRLLEVWRGLGVGAYSQAGRPDYRRPQDRALQPPRPGRLFRAVPAEPEPAPAPRPGLSRGPATGAPDGPTGVSSASGKGEQPQVSDPLRTPPEAPPSPARPLSALEIADLIRTEEELRGR